MALAGIIDIIKDANMSDRIDEIAQKFKEVANDILKEDK